VHSPSCSTAYPSTAGEQPQYKSEYRGGNRTLSHFVTSYDTSHPVEGTPSPCDIRAKSNTDTLHPQQFNINIKANQPVRRTRLLGPRPFSSCGSVHNSYQILNQPSNYSSKAIHERTSHINPSCPGCFPIRGIFRISSSVTSSLLNSPPCTTKYRFTPAGERIAFSLGEGGGGRVALIRVASGTDCRG
jgi:hypothetical protein